jgi:hypothetical protein
MVPPEVLTVMLPPVMAQAVPAPLPPVAAAGAWNTRRVCDTTPIVTFDPASRTTFVPRQVEAPEVFPVTVPAWTMTEAPSFGS